MIATYMYMCSYMCSYMQSIYIPTTIHGFICSKLSTQLTTAELVLAPWTVDVRIAPQFTTNTAVVITLEFVFRARSVGVI